MPHYCTQNIDCSSIPAVRGVSVAFAANTNRATGFCLLVLIAGGLLTACAPPTPESTTTVLQKFVAAFNAKDQPAVMALFGDACEVYRRNYYYAGRSEIAAWVRESIENYRDHYEIVEVKAQGNRATGLFRIKSEGSERFYLPGDYYFTFQAEVIAGKITCLNVGQLDPGICW